MYCSVKEGLWRCVTGEVCVSPLLTLICVLKDVGGRCKWLQSVNLRDLLQMISVIGQGLPGLYISSL